MDETTAQFDVAGAIRHNLATLGDAPALAFEGRWRSWRWYETARRGLAAIAGTAAVPPRRTVLIARNRPADVAALVAQIADRRPTTMVYSAQSADAIAADLRGLRPALVLGSEADWAAAAIADAVADSGAAGAILRDDPTAPITPHPQFPMPRTRSGIELPPDAGVEVLTSGTTGTPKRVCLSWQSIAWAVADASAAYAGSADRNAPGIVLHPLGNIAGLTFVIPPAAYGQPIVLLSRFEVAAWADVVSRYRPTRCSLPPAAIRMVLDAGIAPTALASLRVVAVGGGRLEPDVQQRFEAAYGIPVLTAYGATEFGGVVANWSVPLYREFGPAKPGSVGRASPNVALRVVDALTGEKLPPGAPGLLEARVARIGPGWIRSTDLASIDDEGFVYLHGRSDGAINRSGFKIMPDHVAATLRRHPAVADAVVVGLPDPRLGEVPAAMVERAPEAGDTDEAALLDFARARLLAYEVPVTIRVVDALPRNDAMKVLLPAVREMLRYQ